MYCVLDIHSWEEDWRKRGAGDGLYIVVVYILNLIRITTYFYTVQ